ncbi:MAG: hypothetical protein WB869_10925 [Candidatus Acidiferrales bacterium]
MITHQNDALGNPLERQAGERNEVDIIGLGAQILKPSLTLRRALKRGSTTPGPRCHRLMGCSTGLSTGEPVLCHSVIGGIPIYSGGHIQSD